MRSGGVSTSHDECAKLVDRPAEILAARADREGGERVRCLTGGVYSDMMGMVEGIWDENLLCWDWEP